MSSFNEAVRHWFGRRPAPDEPDVAPDRSEDHFSADVTARCPVCLARSGWADYWVMLDLTDHNVVDFLIPTDLALNLQPNVTWDTAEPDKEGVHWVTMPAVEAMAHAQMPLGGWVLLDPSHPQTRDLVVTGRDLGVLTHANAVRVCPTSPSLLGRPLGGADQGGPPTRFLHGDVVIPDWIGVPDVLDTEGNEQPNLSADVDTDLDLFPGYRVDPKSVLHHAALSYGNGPPVYLIPVLGDSQAGKSSWILRLAITPSTGRVVTVNGTEVEFLDVALPSSITKIADQLIDDAARLNFFDSFYFGTEKSRGAHLLIEVRIKPPGRDDRMVRLLLADFAGEALKQGQRMWHEPIMKQAMAYASGVVFLRTAADLVVAPRVVARDTWGDPFVIPGAHKCVGNRTIPAAYAISQADILDDEREGKRLLIQDRPRPDIGGRRRRPSATEAETTSKRVEDYMYAAARTLEDAFDDDDYNDSHPRFGVFSTAHPDDTAEEVIHATTVAVGALVKASLRDGDFDMIVKSNRFEPYSAHAFSSRLTVGLYEPLLALLYNMNLLS